MAEQLHLLPLGIVREPNFRISAETWSYYQRLIAGRHVMSPNLLISYGSPDTSLDGCSATLCFIFLTEWKLDTRRWHPTLVNDGEKTTGYLIRPYSLAKFLEILPRERFNDLSSENLTSVAMWVPELPSFVNEPSRAWRYMSQVEFEGTLRI